MDVDTATDLSMDASRGVWHGRRARGKREECEDGNENCRERTPVLMNTELQGRIGKTPQEMHAKLRMGHCWVSFAFSFFGTTTVDLVGRGQRQWGRPEFGLGRDEVGAVVDLDDFMVRTQETLDATQSSSIEI